MKTKLGASLIAALMMMGLFGVSAAQADPDPNGSAKKGLCTAYFNGRKVGHDKHDDPGPFQGLEDAAAESDGVDNNGENGTDEDGETIDDSTDAGDLEQAEAVFAFCDDVIIGGNSEHGRYSCETADDETSCTRNEKPGKGDDR